MSHRPEQKSNERESSPALLANVDTELENKTTKTKNVHKSKMILSKTSGEYSLSLRP